MKKKTVTVLAIEYSKRVCDPQPEFIDRMDVRGLVMSAYRSGYIKAHSRKKMNKEEFQTKKNDIDSKIRELNNQKIQLEKEYIESNQEFPVGSKVCITVPAHERYTFWNNERILVPEAKKLAYIADYDIDDNGEVVPSLRQLDYNGGMSAIPLFVNLKKAIIELV